MEAVANAKNRSLYAPSSGMVANAVQIKDSNELEHGESLRLIDINRQSTAENMYLSYAIYRRLIDGSYCILAVRNNGESIYYDEI
jgi:hypothetical protein